MIKSWGRFPAGNQTCRIDVSTRWAQQARSCLWLPQPHADLAPGHAHLSGSLAPASSCCRTAAGTSPAVKTVARFFQPIRSCEVYSTTASDSQSQRVPSDTFCFWLLPYLQAMTMDVGVAGALARAEWQLSLESCAAPCTYGFCPCGLLAAAAVPAAWPSVHVCRAAAAAADRNSPCYPPQVSVLICQQPPLMSKHLQRRWRRQHVNAAPAANAFHICQGAGRQPQKHNSCSVVISALTGWPPVSVGTVPELNTTSSEPCAAACVLKHSCSTRQSNPNAALHLLIFMSSEVKPGGLLIQQWGTLQRGDLG